MSRLRETGKQREERHSQHLEAGQILEGALGDVRDAVVAELQFAQLSQGREGRALDSVELVVRQVSEK